jgi:hypothetical protein
MMKMKSPECPEWMRREFSPVRRFDDDDDAEACFGEEGQEEL